MAYDAMTGETRVLKEHGNLVLVIRLDFNWCRSKTVKKYHVYYSDQDKTENYSGRYNMTSKAEALKVFNTVKKSGSFGCLVQAGA